MSFSKYEPTKYTPKQQEKQYLNLIYNAHDQFCFCKEPANHTIYLLQKTKQCPGTEITTKEDGDDPGFDVGDLENLFAEDTDTQERG